MQSLSIHLQSQNRRHSREGTRNRSVVAVVVAVEEVIMEAVQHADKVATMVRKSSEHL